MRKDQIDEIIAAQIAGEVLTEEEQKLLLHWRQAVEQNEWYYQQLSRLSEPVSRIREKGGIGEEKAFRQFSRRMRQNRKKRILRYAGISAAAVIVIALGISFSLWIRPSGNFPATISRPPGSGQVILTLRNGKVIPLKQEGKDILLADSSLRVIQESNTLVYESKNKQTEEKENYNQLMVPGCGEYRIILSDGTKVFLNAGSELRYPEIFKGKYRDVYLKGEAWFEVARDTSRKFRVHTGNIRVTALGTSFNVRAYEQMETIAATLETGCVEIRCAQEYFRMFPGEQFVYNKPHGQTSLRKVDTELYTSWKDGYYKFRQATLEEIMTTLSLWYGLNIFYQQEEAKHLEFTGKVKRYEDVGNLLRQFEQTENITFRRQENTIVIQLK